MDQIFQKQQKLKEALLSLNRLQAESISKRLTKERDSLSLVEEIFIPVLEDIGQGWEEGKYGLSQVYWSARFCEEWIAQNLLDESGTVTDNPRMAIAVLEDFHSLGKTIVCSIIRSAGFTIEDFGIGISASALVEKTMEENIEILLISTLMLPSALSISEVYEQFQQKNYPVKLVVGGAPFRIDPDLVKEVRADYIVKSAADVIKVIRSIIQIKHSGT
ncbi:MAG: cobalamin-dependent protein [gamma proteobacterium symbiont of Taylorina sp.]|nr:cobalamin-dependent protein [gamma proteobacterium symbiont of Taylorina sp.]